MIDNQKDRLGSLLQQADANFAGPPALPADLPQRVRVLAGRRRRNRRITASALVGVICIAGIGLLAVSFHTDGQEADQRLATVERAATQQTHEIADLRAEIAKLRAEVGAREAAVRQVVAEEDAQRLRAQLRESKAYLATRWSAEKSMDEAVMIIIYGADVVFETPGGKPNATAAYQDVVRLFPGTRWAAIAEKRLEHIQPAQGEQL